MGDNSEAGKLKETRRKNQVKEKEKEKEKEKASKTGGD